MTLRQPISTPDLRLWLRLHSKGPAGWMHVWRTCAWPPTTWLMQFKLELGLYFLWSTHHMADQPRSTEYSRIEMWSLTTPPPSPVWCQMAGVNAAGATEQQQSLELGEERDPAKSAFGSGILQRSSCHAKNDTFSWL